MVVFTAYPKYCNYLLNAFGIPKILVFPKYWYSQNTGILEDESNGIPKILRYSTIYIIGIR